MTTPGPERAVPPAQPGRRAFDALFEDPSDPAGPGGPADPVEPSPEYVVSAAESDSDPSPADEVGEVAEAKEVAEAVEVPDRVADVDSGPLRPGPTIDTGRLFRSAGADGVTATNAIPALTEDRLRTERARRGLDSAAPPVDAPSVDEAGYGLEAAPDDLVATPGTESPDDAQPEPHGDGPILAAASVAGAAVPGSADAPPAGADPVVPVIPGGAGSGSQADAGATPAAAEAASIARPDSARGLTGTGVWVVVVGVTVLVGFADALLGLGSTLGWITGLALVASTLYAALTARAPDLWLAVIVPPLAFLAATLTAGQLTLPGGQGLLVREGVMVFTTLSVNAPWIVGATVLALVIVLIRRARFRRSGVL